MGRPIHRYPVSIPSGFRRYYERFATEWTEYAKDAVNNKFGGTVPLIKVEETGTLRGLTYATPNPVCRFFDTYGLVTDAESMLALSVMLYNANEEWKEGDVVPVKTCSTGYRDPKKVKVTRKLMMAFMADRQNIESGAVRTVLDHTYGYCYKLGQPHAIFVACHSVLVTEGMVICCRCIYDSLKKNVKANEMDSKTQHALRSVITKRSWYRDRKTILRTSMLYIIFSLTVIVSGVLIHIEQYEVAVSLLVPGLTLWHYLLSSVAGQDDMGRTFALTFCGSEECVGSHINMVLGNQGRPIWEKGDEGKHELVVGTFVSTDKKLEKTILRFISAAMCTAKMREVLRPTNSYALGENIGVKTLWDIVMTSRRIRNLGCLLTDKFYVVHTASGLKAFEVSSVSTTARHTNWKEISEDVVGIIEQDHVILG